MLFSVVLLYHVVNAFNHAHLLIDYPLELFNVLHLSALKDLATRRMPYHIH